MISRDLNSLVRTMLTNLIEKGWQKTKLFKLIMGEPAQVSRFLTPDENDLPRDFGIKPLQRIGQLLDYDLHFVYINKNEEDATAMNNQKVLLEEIEKNNLEFVRELKDKIEERLQENISSLSRNGQSNTGVDRLIENLLEDD